MLRRYTPATSNIKCCPFTAAAYTMPLLQAAQYATNRGVSPNLSLIKWRGTRVSKGQAAAASSSYPSTRASPRMFACDAGTCFGSSREMNILCGSKTMVGIENRRTKGSAIKEPGTLTQAAIASAQAAAIRVALMGRIL